MKTKTIVGDLGNLPPMPEPTEEDLEAWADFVADLPENVRPVCKAFPPWKYYRMPKTGQIVTVLSYADDCTMTVLVVGDAFSVPAIFETEVFGVPPTDLEAA